MFAPVRETKDKLTFRWSERELESISDYLGKLAMLWEEERKKHQGRNKAK